MKLIRKNSLAIIASMGIIFSQDASFQVYGFITDSTSGEALIGANVFIRETGQGMATDNNGYYVLSNISIKSSKLVVSYVGYEKFEKAIDFSETTSQNINVSLNPESFDSALFAEGALTAARWIVGKKPGLYSMRNVLNFK